MFERILNDNYILEFYENIKKYELANKALAFHGKTHALNVAKLVEEILKITDCDDKTIESGKVAALLHDLGCYCGKDDHEIRSYKLAKDYIEKNNILLDDKEQVLEAIKDHRNNFDSSNIITVALILADKLDIKRDRVAPEGFNVIGMRQLQYINDIVITKNNNNLVVKFITGEMMDIEELLDFYFMKKVLKSIENFSKNQNMGCLVTINDIDITKIYDENSRKR